MKNGGFEVVPANTTIYTVGIVIKYFCNPGYKLEAGENERTCLENGTWSGDQPSCISKQFVEGRQYLRKSVKIRLYTFFLRTSKLKKLSDVLRFFSTT